MESRIIKKAISGDSEALAILIDNYKDIAFNLALGITKNKENAKDIVQDSLLKVLENIESFRSESKFSTWLYRIVYNQSIGFAAKMKQVDLVEHDPDLIFENSEDDEIQEERFQELYKAIDSLNDSERNIVTLFYLADKSVKDIAIITSLSNMNVKVILHRARKKLYNMMSYGRY